jgi:signal transduction histidine kinase/CheY-like chemotaxis protein
MPYRPVRVAAPDGGRSIDARTLLLILPLLVAGPLVAYGTFLLYVTANQASGHARHEQAAAHAALEATLARELQRMQQVLQIVAESPALGDVELDTERAGSLAAGVVRSEVGLRSVAILDRSGAVLVEVPARGEPSRSVKLTPRQLKALETGRSTVSDLHESPIDVGLSVSVDVPVRRGARSPWLVTAVLDPVHLTRTLSTQIGARDALSTVLDANRRILARTRDLQRYFGESPSRETLDALDGGDHGWRRFRTRDGNAYLWTWSTLPSGWTVWLGSPAREFDDALRGSILHLAGAGFGILLLAMGASTLLARRFAATVDRLAESAHRLAAGERPAYAPSGVRQLDALHGALVDANEEAHRAIADRDRALEAERAARAIADEHNRSKDAFLGMLSHELRNPLAPIRNSVYVLAHAEPGGEKARRARTVIERQTEHLTRIVDDLLDVTRIARGKILLHRRRIELTELVRRAADDAQLAIEERGVRLRVDVPAERLWIDADATRVTQILGNLLSNAAKFTLPGDEISVALRRAGAAAEITVRDTGAGIDPELLPHVFDAFVQGARTLARSEGGLGLGLALVKGLVELHGGSVRARSEGPGKGAELVVSLPLVDAAAGEPPAPPRAEAAPRGRRVLVIDDNADAADTLAELVRLFGHEVEVAYSGGAGIEKARRWRPDVVLCDIGLPGVTGYDVARALRDEQRGLRLVAVSGYAQEEDVRKATEAGFDAHIAKPPDPAKVAELVGRGP